MRSIVYLQVIFFLTGLLVSSVSPAEEKAAAVNALNFSKAWFKPRLLEDHNPICKDMLNLTDKAFFSDSPTLNQYFAKALPKIFTTFDSLPQIVLGGNTIYLSTYNLKGCGGACERYQLLASTNAFPKHSTEEFYESLLALAPPSYPDGEVLLFAEQDSVNYFYFSFSENLEIYQLQADAKWQKSCVIATSPSNMDIGKKYSTQKITDSLTALNHSINAITGKSGNCGSMATSYRWRVRIEKALPMAIYRPWAMYESEIAPHYTSNYKDDFADIEAWSKTGLDQHSKFSAYRQQFKKTSQLLSDFYQTSYDWGKQQSDNLAKQSLEFAISSGVRFINYNPFSDVEKQLRKAIIQKKPLSEIKSYPVNYSSLNKVTPRGDDSHEEQESILNLAITYPEILVYLLSKDLSPNIDNTFGKTPLMYAAQYNQLESARILLDKGANPNAFTIIPEDNCNYTLSKSKMTALHYAVRYASPELIELLIAKGANPYAKTSEKDGYPIDWLRTYTASNATEPNPNIPPAQVARTEKLLALPSTEEINRKTLEYNLQAEKEYNNGNINAAYELILKAINFNQKDDRAQANMGLIALKAGKEGEALEATQNLISYSQDATQKANAWFNYGLICEKHLPTGYVNYNGITYCNENLLLSFIESYKLKPTPARANKIIGLFINKKIANCSFTKDNTRLLLRSWTYQYTNSLFVLQPKGKLLDSKDFSWTISKEINSSGNTGMAVRETIQINPEKLQADYDLGDYKLSILAAKSSIYLPIQFGKEICTDKYEIQPAPNP